MCIRKRSDTSLVKTDFIILPLLLYLLILKSTNENNYNHPNISQDSGREVQVTENPIQTNWEEKKGGEEKDLLTHVNQEVVLRFRSQLMEGW